MKIQIVSCSASEPSVGRSAAAYLANFGRRRGAIMNVHHLKDTAPRWISKDFFEEIPEPFKQLRASSVESDGIILIVPIYSYDVASVGKFAGECLGAALKGKPLMIVASCTTPRSHLAIQSFVFGLISDWKVHFYPEFVFVGNDDLSPDSAVKDNSRLTHALDGFMHFAKALSKSSTSQGSGPISTFDRTPLPLANIASHTSPQVPFSAMLDRLTRVSPTLAPYIHTLGNTPLIELPAPPNGARIFGKCEWHNPFGSVKDRTAFALVARLLWEEPDLQHSDARIVEYSGGNLGISLAHIGKHLGVPISVYLHGKSSRDVVEKIEALGGEAVLVEPGSGFFGVMKEAFERYRSDPTTRLLYQHVNDINPSVHEQTTGQEIVSALRSSVDADTSIHWIASVGTGGTLAGVSRALRKAFGRVNTYALSPAELPYGSQEPPNDLAKLAGSGGFGDGYRQPFISQLETDIHAFPCVSYGDAIRAAATLREQIGEAVSSSGAAAWLTAYREASACGHGNVFVVMLPSKATDAERELVEAAPTSSLTIQKLQPAFAG